MQETLYQRADAEVSLSDSRCRRHSIRQRMQETLSQPADAGVSLLNSRCRRQFIRQRMQKSPYADAGDTLSDWGRRSLGSDSRCRSLYETADAGVSLSDSGCKRHSIRQRMQKSLYQSGCRTPSVDAGETLSAADAEVSLSDAGDTLSDSRCRRDSGCRRHSIRQRMQKSLYQTADTGDNHSDSG